MTTRDLVVVTFNIRNGLAPDGRNAWPLRRPATAEALRQLGADLVGLQEAYAFQLRYLLRALDGYNATGDGRSRRRRGERCAVLTRRARLRVVHTVTRWFGATPDRPGSRLPGAKRPRAATVVRLVDEESGVDLDVVNTHLDDRVAENRVASLRQLATWVAPSRPTIVMGDFNTTPHDAEAFSVLHRAGLRPALGDIAPGTAHQFRGGTSGPHLDHVLVSRHFEVVEASVAAGFDGRLPSDHWPVRAVLRPV